MAGLMLAACSTAPRQPETFKGSPAAPSIPAEAPKASVGVASRPSASSPARTVNTRLLGAPRAQEDGDQPLGVGDLIEVTVFDVPEFSNIKVRIPNGGQVSLPLVGAVTASGLTPLALQTEIGTQLRRKYMHDPQVTIFVHEQKSQRVSVVGAVRLGGVFPLTGQLRLADALGLAGGITEEAGAMVHLIRRLPVDAERAGAHGATEPVMHIIDLESLAAGKQELNLPLQAGDVVEVPRAGMFYVGGEVQKPGAFPLKARTTLDQAPMAAGGVRDVADWSDVRLYRARPDGTKEVHQFSLNDFEDGKTAPELQANDIVIVGKSGTKAVLFGLRDFVRMGLGMTLQ
jgi:polysaccharide export outer membrane protein